MSKRIIVAAVALSTLSGCATALSSIEWDGQVYWVTHLELGFLGNVAGKLLACVPDGREFMRCREVATP